MLSNHFRFQNINNQGHIFIYRVDFGVFDTDRETQYEALRSLQTQLKATFGVYITYGFQIFTPTQSNEILQFNATVGGNFGDIRISPNYSFQISEQTNELRKKAQIKDIMDFVTKIVKNALGKQDYK